MTKPKTADGYTPAQLEHVRATLLFLVSILGGDGDRSPRLRAIPDSVTPGLRLAFHDREVVRVEGRTLLGEIVARDVPVCGPGAFVVLKALPFGSEARTRTPTTSTT